MFLKRQHLHFTGIGGIGMSGIAEVLLNLGYEISGSDVKLSPITERLARLGAVIYEGHAAENVAGAKALVVTSAVSPTNPELAEARRLRIPIIPRGELLAELMRLKFGIAVAGSHGKTTTTSMTAAILSEAQKDPTVVVGGRVGAMGGSNARVGKSDYLVVESDESDGSFLKLSPIVAVVTNIDREHLDHYPSIEAIRAAFLEFVNRVPFYGATILCLEDENIQRILPDVNRRVITYGRTPQALLEVTEAKPGATSSEFELQFRGEDLGKFRIGVPGVHNILNAAAAAAVALELDIDADKIRAGLAAFSGVDRRFQLRGREAGVTVVDDYGHHPTEIQATLAAARLGGYSRVIVIFQPHRYTRTQELMDDFARAFHASDAVLVLDIYAASEAPIAGVHSPALVEKIVKYGHRSAEYTPGIDDAVARAAEIARPGDLVLTLGAGNVWQAGERLLERLRVPAGAAGGSRDGR